MTANLNPADTTAIASTVRRRPVRARRRLVPALAGALLLAGAATACSSDSDAEDASQKVCEARDDLRTSVGAVTDALSSANLGSASDAMDTVRADYEALRVATGELSEAERERLQPQLDAVRAQVEALADVRDVEGLRAGIEAVGVSFEQIFTDISETLDCS